MITLNSNDGVHVRHCCILHGCKYGDKNCPVVNKKVPQLFLCESCNDGSDDPFASGGKVTVENLRAMTRARFCIGDRVVHFKYGHGTILGNYHKRGQAYYWHIQYDDNTFGYNTEKNLNYEKRRSCCYG